MECYFCRAVYPDSQTTTFEGFVACKWCAFALEFAQKGFTMGASLACINSGLQDLFTPPAIYSFSQNPETHKIRFNVPNREGIIYD